MTVEAITRKAGPYDYTSSGQYPFYFKVFAQSDIYVIATDADGVETQINADTDYTVTLNENQDNDAGGYVTLLQDYTGSKITIGSDVPYTQEVIITNKGGFYPDTLNKAYDKLTILCQQNREILDRALKVGISSSVSADDYKGELEGIVNQSVASAASAAASAQQAATSSAQAVSDAASALSKAESALAQSDTALGNAQSALAQSDTALGNAQSAVAASDTALGTARQAQTDAQNALDESGSALATSQQASATSAQASENAATALSQSATALSRSETAIEQSTVALTQSGTALENATDAVNSIQPALSAARQASTDAAEAVEKSSQALAETGAIDEKVEQAVNDAISGVTIPGLSMETITGALGYTPYDAESNSKDFATNAEVAGAIAAIPELTPETIAGVLGYTPYDAGTNSEDFATNAEVAGAIAAIPEPVNADWNASNGAAAILNKPSTIAGYGIVDAYTKTQVDTKIAEKDCLPTQTGQTGKYLSTDGETPYWEKVDTGAMEVVEVETSGETTTLDIAPGKAYFLTRNGEYAFEGSVLEINSLPEKNNLRESSIWFDTQGQSVTIQINVEHKIVDAIPETEPYSHYVISIMGNTLIMQEMEKKPV